MASVAEAARAMELEEMVEDWAREREARPRPAPCVPVYANDRQVVWTSDRDPRIWCSDHRARLRWRVVPAPEIGIYALHPRNGVVVLKPDDSLAVLPGHVATLRVGSR